MSEGHSTSRERLLLRSTRQRLERMDARILRKSDQLRRAREELSELASARSKIIDVLRQWGSRVEPEEEGCPSFAELDELLGVRSLK
jgi:hypothetical protein